MHGNREISYLAASEVMERSASGRRGVEADEARAGEVRPLHNSIEADEQTWATGAELVEPRERTEGNMGEQHTYRTLCRIKRVPEARLCTRSCSWDSSLTTRGGSPVRELRPPGSVRGASSNGCPYRDRSSLLVDWSANALRRNAQPPSQSSWSSSTRFAVKRAVIEFWSVFF